MNLHELKPINRQKSFYKKAHWFEDEDGKRFLISYSTLVAYIDTEGELHRLWDGWSATTSRHVDSFLGEGVGKAAWTKMPVENVIPNISVSDMRSRTWHFA